MKTPAKQSALDADRFISGAKTAELDQVPRESKARPAAGGFFRASFDLSEDLHLRLKIAAARQRCPMREIVEAGISAELEKLGY